MKSPWFASVLFSVLMVTGVVPANLEYQTNCLLGQRQRLTFSADGFPIRDLVVTVNGVAYHGETNSVIVPASPYYLLTAGHALVKVAPHRWEPTVLNVAVARYVYPIHKRCHH